MTKRLTLEDFISRSQEVHGNRYDYSRVVYLDARTKVIIICHTHGRYEQAPHKHMSGQGCHRCSGCGKKTTEEFIEDAQSVHGNRYDYSMVKYTGAHNGVDIICNTHGPFSILPANHTNQKSGCPTCSGNVAKTTNEFIKDARLVHGDRYDYSMVKYTMSSGYVDVVCKSHGVFGIIAHNHLSGHGCKACAVDANADVRRITRDDFITRANRVHDGYYDYDGIIDITGARNKVLIGCPTHGEFVQIPDKHLSGQGCPRCSHRISRPSIEWLDSLGIPDDPEHREVGGLVGRYIADGYDPETNTVYEFHGDYWHGNPQIYESSDINPTTKTTYGQLYQKTIEKKSKFTAQGFAYVEIWETDWQSMINCRRQLIDQ